MKGSPAQQSPESRGLWAGVGILECLLGMMWCLRGVCTDSIIIPRHLAPLSRKTPVTKVMAQIPKQQDW